MIKLIVGNKGAGKTKTLINMANEAVKNSNGNVVVVEKGLKLTYDIDHAARLVDTEEYKIEGFNALFGFLAGLMAGNYDITNILVDATLKIGGQDKEELAAMIDRLAGLAQEHKVELAFTVSCALEDLPETLKGYAI
jgi:ABC-type cobalamin/Fe3+-siderophores transport system ATPase subunit